jgi:hypothetical protein
MTKIPEMSSMKKVKKKYPKKASTNAKVRTTNGWIDMVIMILVPLSDESNLPLMKGIKELR